ncbi:MAG: nicotinate (nicotinamide) nucleotide adenylyltransferase [Muribaculaceae bacterium]|nr:nicotinate (nicotinamide) nucleotide adenylyltransferase [Muribaculaceae bacterium]
MHTVIYSGSFNPIHTGHAMLASWVSGFCPEVDELWLTVTPHNPLKNKAADVSDEHRLAMARLVADTLPRVKVCDFEFSQPRPSYTYHTLCAMARKWPDRHFRLLIGSDNWLIFDKWRNAQEIIREFGVYIYLRPGYPVQSHTLPENVTLLEGAPQTDLSSTFIREGLRAGHDMNYFLPTSVNDYIIQHNLY